MTWKTRSYRLPSLTLDRFGVREGKRYDLVFHVMRAARERHDGWIVFLERLELRRSLQLERRQLSQQVVDRCAAQERGIGAELPGRQLARPELVEQVAKRSLFHQHFR